MYDSQYEEPYWKLYHILTKKLIEGLLLKYSRKSPLKILDLGSGTGLWMEYFLERGDEVTCLEPSKKTSASVNAICEKILFEEQSFDILNAQGDVFSYSLDLSRAVSESYRVLKPGGVLIGSVDNLFAFLNDAVCVADFETFKKIVKTKKSQIGNSGVSQRTFETNPFTPDALERLLSNNHFEDIEIGGKIVFGPYEEEVIIEKIAEIAAKYAYIKELTGKAERLHFSARKPLYK
ncbi:MAG: methyltransferase domain-containing protein [Thermotogota bacterium]|nr:methyltransferase domain-containing protein [Thermotogota bacterium]